MARPFTVAERADVGNESHVTHILLQVEDPDGTFREVTNFLGYDWFLSARWAGDTDRGFETGTVRLHRYGAELNISLSPEIGGSPANRNAIGGYAPFLELGRKIRWQTVVKPRGVTPAPADYRPAFDGYIAQLGGDEAVVEIECTDKGGPLMRVQIDEKRRYGAGGAGVLAEIPLQQLIDDWADAPPALTVPTPVGRVVGLWDQDVGSLLENLRAVASQGGQDIRYKWGADDVSRLTYWTPNRADIETQPVIDWLDPGEYLRAHAIEKDIASVRSKAIVRFVKADGTAGVQMFEDLASRAKYGRITAEVQRDKTSTIRTDAEALTLATTIVHDLAVPIADHKIEALYYPWVEIGDVIGCRADGRYYDSDQKFAVAGYEHRIENGEGFTDFLVRGRVGGQYRIWIRSSGGGIGGRGATPIVDPVITETTSRQTIVGIPAGVLELSVYDPSLAIVSVEFATRVGDAGAWSAWSADAPPYAASVALVAGQSSAIMYRVTGLRSDGSSGVLRQTVVEFPATGGGTILPTGYATTSENGLLATTTLRVYDPQARRTSVDFAYGFANAPLVAPTVVAPNGAGLYVYAAPLREKQPTRIEWRIWGLAADGTTQVLDSGFIRSGIGAKPLQPDIRPEVTASGILTAVVRGDSDTDQMRVLVKLDAEPTIAEIDTLGHSFADRTAPYIHDTPLPPGTRYYIGARAYNVDTPDPGNPALPGYASDPAVLSDVWTGPSGNRATVRVVRAVATDTAVTFEGIEFGPLCSLVEVYAVEYRGDPGAVSSVFGIGYRPPTAPIRVSGSSIVVPISIPGNYVAVTFAAVDINGRIGADNAGAVGVFAGIVTLKVQSASASSARPPAPQDLAVSSIGIANNAINLDVTAPAALGTASKFRVFRDGAPYGSDVAISVAGGAVQRIVVPATPNTTYTHQVYSVDAAGIISAIGSPARSITLGIGQVPKPVVAMGAFELPSWTFPVTITPGAGTPAGVTWRVAVKRSPDEVAYVEKAPRTTTTFNLPAEGIVVGGEPHTYRFYLRIFGEAVGYTPSPLSDEVYQDVAVS